MVLMFGAMFWEISIDPYAKRALIKYVWLEKCVTALSVPALTLAVACQENRWH
jgi:hypothetical protein